MLLTCQDKKSAEHFARRDVDSQSWGFDGPAPCGRMAHDSAISNPDLPIVGRIGLAKPVTNMSIAIVTGCLAAFPKQFGIGEFPRPQRPQLPAHAGALHPAKRRPRVRPYKVVDEHRAALDLCGHPVRPHHILAEHRCRQAIFGIVRQADVT